MWGAFVIGFIAGIAATPHCLGMCGGFPLHLAKSSGRGSAALRQALFVLGKGFTYIFLGALAAALGTIVFRDSSLAHGAPLLRIVAGSLTALFGLLMLGLRLPPIKAIQKISDAGIVRSLYGGLLVGPGSAAAFVLGMGTGLIPCPLPMGMLAVSAASHNVVHGVALMAGVGLGTAPGLLAVGLFGIGIDRRFARVGMRVAGIVVLMIGIITIGRATGIIHANHPVARAVPSCCEGHND
jgi:sulfite exporter TauE/SafE